MQNDAFDRFAGDVGNHVDPALVERDLEALRSTTSGVVHFATRTVAHLDKRGVDQEITFGELNRALDTLSDLVRRYHLLVTGSSLLRVEPTMQGDWKAPFRIPLFPRGT
jgi:hypothetical protein